MPALISFASELQPVLGALTYFGECGLGESMSLRSCREIRNQLLALVGTAAAVLATTTLVLEEGKTDMATAAEFAPIRTKPEVVPEFAVNWDDVNLQGEVTAPEDEVKTARSKMFSDFEAQ